MHLKTYTNSQHNHNTVQNTANLKRPGYFRATMKSQPRDVQT